MFVARWGELHPRQHGADAIDEQLHAERIDPATREHRLHRLPYDELPDGAFVVHDGVPKLVHDAKLRAWSTGGYGAMSPRPASGEAVVITPPSLLAVLSAGWDGAVPLLHPSASG